jgi:integrase
MNSRSNPTAEITTEAALVGAVLADPRQAAEVLSNMDQELAVKILTGMKPKVAGEIMTYVKTDKAAKLTDVTPHTLKHTAATWLLRAGIDLWDVAGLTSTSAKTLETVYGHHSPEFQKASAKAFRRA